MSATPIIPGSLYRVHGMGRSITVIASSSCEAIVIALDALCGASA